MKEARINSPIGEVLGIDVGYSAKNRSSAVCLLEWDRSRVRWTIERFRACSTERTAAIHRVAGGHRLSAAAFDGPLRRGLELIGVYRMAERMLVRRLQPKIGKPGQSSTKVGKSLNAAANDCVRTVLEEAFIDPAKHELAIHDLAIVEAFPSTFMGLLLADPMAVPAIRKNRSDTFYVHLARSGGLQSILDTVLPGRVPDREFDSVTNHDDRAGVICALTALCVAKGNYCAVGDDNGWIVLPPRKLIADWAWKMLSENAAEDGASCLRSFQPQGGSVN